MEIEVEAQIIINLEYGISEHKAILIKNAIEENLKKLDYWKYIGDIELDY